MRVRRLLTALLSAALLPVAGCGTFARSYDPAGVDELTIPTPSPDPDDYVGTVDNPWLPLKPGTTLTYDVVLPDRPAASRTVTVLPGQVEIAGVPTTAVRTAQGAEEVTDYYAQDERGNVWWFGHQAAAGSWRAEEQGAEAGLAMAATPRTGDGYRTAYLPGVVEDIATVVDVEGQADGDELQVEVGSALDPAALRTQTYERGVGLVGTVDAGSGERDRLQR